MGWTEDCSGGTTTTLHVNGPKRCAASFEPIVAVAPRTLLRWESQAGNFIGQGRSEVLSPVNSRWTPVRYQNGNGVEFTVEQRWADVGFRTGRCEFQAPTGELLQAGPPIHRSRRLSRSGSAAAL